MPQSEGNPLDGQQLANDLDALFKSGDLSALFVSTPAEPVEPAVDKALKIRLNGYMYNFVNKINPGVLRALGRRDAVGQVRNYFEAWKPNLVNGLRVNRFPQPEIRAVENLTLKDVAVYAGERFSQASKKAATSPFGSSEQRWAREQSNYWSIMQEIIAPVADPDK
ncbi:MAG: hypothetical protein Q7K55_05490 [Candidatus Levybacteria bacterium]|nr:hypothetical protein [Candidatus Levybacteria bacterium]